MSSVCAKYKVCGRFYVKRREKGRAGALPFWVFFMMSILLLGNGNRRERIVTCLRRGDVGGKPSTTLHTAYCNTCGKIKRIRCIICCVLRCIGYLINVKLAGGSACLRRKPLDSYASEHIVGKAVIEATPPTADNTCNG